MSNRTDNLSVSMPEGMKEEIEEEADERSMTLSEYGRLTIIAGRKQIAALEEEIEGDGSLALEQEVLDVVPTEPSDALSHEEIAEEVLAEVEQQIFKLLDNDSRISHSATHGGYYVA